MYFSALLSQYWRSLHITSFQIYILGVKEHSKTIFKTIWYVHKEALVFVLENLLSNLMRSPCYRHCAWSLSKNWMAMINRNYQAEKFLKRLQNNPIKNHVKFKKFPKSTHAAFSIWLLHSSVIVLADSPAQAYILGSAGQYQNAVVLFAVTFYGLSQD